MEINCEECEDKTCSSKQRKPNETEEEYIDRQKLEARLCKIKHKLIVLSGKGGVGKSTVAVNIAFTLAKLGKKVGLLDIDLHGPSIPRMLNLQKEEVVVEDNVIQPIEIGLIKIVSMAFFLPGPDDPVIWRGPMKIGVIRQFLRDVEWGELDYLVIDSPPGTGDEPLTVCQLIENITGAVIVTTPQEVAITDVRRSVKYCHQVNLPIIGVVENMSGFICPHCGKGTDIFKSGGGEKMARDMKIPFLGKIPIDPQIGESGENGKSFVQQFAETKTAQCMENIIQPIVDLCEK
jgi:ATP-binding protein involved in chromosome partitioning